MSGWRSVPRTRRQLARRASPKRVPRRIGRLTIARWIFVQIGPEAESYLRLAAPGANFNVNRRVMPA